MVYSDDNQNNRADSTYAYMNIFINDSIMLELYQ